MSKRFWYLAVLELNIFTEKDIRMAGSEGSEGIGGFGAGWGDSECDGDGWGNSGFHDVTDGYGHGAGLSTGSGYFDYGDDEEVLMWSSEK